MRLIDANSLELHYFTDNAVPDYAILSHTWGSQEVSYQDFVLINKLRATSESSRNSHEDEKNTLMLLSMRMLLRGHLNIPASLSGIKEDLSERAGYTKIANAARIALSLGYQWIWIDTCCIDKTSSAEL